MIRKLILPSFLFVCFLLNGQVNTFSLKQCIEYAWMNNLEVRQFVLNSESSSIDLKQSKSNILPSLSAGAGQNYQFGRSIDRFTNQFSNQTIRSNNFSLNANLLLFGGFQTQNNIKLANATQKAAQENIYNIKNQIALNVANAFLQAIQSEENIKNLNFQVETTKQRVIKAQKMVDAGTADLSSLLSLKAQLANEQYNVVTAINAKNASMLNLKTLLQMGNDKDLNLSMPVVSMDIISNAFSVNELYQIAVENMPQIKSAILQNEAAKYQTRTTQGSMFPTIALFGSLSTVYSQSAQIYSNPTIIGTQVIGYTQTNNELVVQPTYSYQKSTKAFNQQLTDNLGQGAGISLSWNIFNAFQVQNQIQKAKINEALSDLNLLKVKNNLLNEINSAMNSYNAAKAKHDAAMNNVEAQKMSFDYIQKRFDAGVTNSYDFIQSKNNLLQSQSNEIQARYELVFRGLILEFYKGNPINL
jgi:outer membrane protein